MSVKVSVETRAGLNIKWSNSLIESSSLCNSLVMTVDCFIKSVIFKRYRCSHSSSFDNSFILVSNLLDNLIDVSFISLRTPSILWDKIFSAASSFVKWNLVWTRSSPIYCSRTQIFLDNLAMSASAADPKGNFIDCPIAEHHALSLRVDLIKSISSGKAKCTCWINKPSYVWMYLPMVITKHGN